jgi:hypothetical protein
MKKFLVGFILFSMVFSVIPGAVAIECYGLYAGQDEYVGTVTIDVVGDILNFNYETIPGWRISEIHLMALNESPNDNSSSWYTEYITKTGNPKVGQFEIKEYFEPCVNEYCGTLNLTEIGVDPYDKLYVAAHAVVCECNRERIFAGFGYEAVNDFWAVNYSNYTEGIRKGGDDRYNASLCLGKADTVSKTTNTFTCMGQGGSMVLYFNGGICGDGNNSTPDLEIYEVTYDHTTNYYETISIEAFYNGSYYPVGNVTNHDGDGNFNDHIFINCIYDLPTGVCIEKIRINEISIGNGDYDLDAIKANYKCVPEYEYVCNYTGNCESAWANDTCFGGETFPGNNWATYVIYPECD